MGPRAASPHIQRQSNTMRDQQVSILTLRYRDSDDEIGRLILGRIGFPYQKIMNELGSTPTSPICLLMRKCLKLEEVKTSTSSKFHSN